MNKQIEKQKKSNIEISLHKGRDKLIIEQINMIDKT